MIDFVKLRKASRTSKRMYILKNICEDLGLDIDYLFGLFNMYNVKNAGMWFWQKASFTGGLKDAYDNFNETVDNIVKDLKQADEKKTTKQIKSASDVLDKLLVGIEMNCNVNRENDFNNVKGFLDKNLKALINDSLKRIE